MMSKLSDYVASWLVKNQAIKEDEQDLYSYAVYSFFFSLIPLLLATVAGMMLHMLIESVLLIIPFLAIRKFSGGFHLKSPVACFLSSVSVIVCFLFIIRAIISNKLIYVELIIMTVSTIQLIIFSPIDSENRRLTYNEIIIFGRITIIISLLFMAIFLLLLIIGCYNFAVPIGMGIILSAILQLPCLLFQRVR